MDDETYPHTGIDAGAADGLVSTVRTTLGDTLRSVVYFTPAAFDVLYVRQDLYDTHDSAREAKAPLVDIERSGFGEAPVRTALAGGGVATGLGEYRFTVRFHADGFVARIIEGNAGVVVTTDAMDVRGFEDAAAAVRTFLTDR